MSNTELKPLAEETLDILLLVATTAIDKLRNRSGDPTSAIANLNSLTGSAAIQQINEIANKESQSLVALQREPAISRVVVENEDGKKIIYYICRTSSIALGDKANLAGYRTSIGKLASRDMGDEVEIDIGGKPVWLRVVERLELHPEKIEQDWDSPNSILRREDEKSVSITSLRKLWEPSIALDDSSAFDAMLAATTEESNITEGLRHQIRSAMALRDQPVLDKFQDDIFRLPIDSQLIILGLPGTGKTTTLIKRLGQKLDWDALEPRERILLDSGKTDWVMFTPSELLKHYVKEAFGREQIPASNEHIKTWDKFRNYLARNVLNILKTNTGGIYYLKEDRLHCSRSIQIDPRDWFEEFRQFHHGRLVDALIKGAFMLRDSASEPSAPLVEKVLANIDSLSPEKLLPSYGAWLNLETEISAKLKENSAATEKLIREQGNLLFNKNKKVFFELATFLESIGPGEDEEDEESEYDEDAVEESQPTLNQVQQAFNAYKRFLQSYARSRYRGRNPGKTSRAARIREWLGDDRAPSDEWLSSLGKEITFQNALRRFRSAWKRYMLNVPAHYRAFRQQCIAMQRFDYITPDNTAHIDSIELDAIVLLLLRSTRELLTQEYVKRDLDKAQFYELSRISSQFQSQVLVDEATDFSVLQLACMESLTSLKTRSFFACGDFNQRITSQGIRSLEQLLWISDRIQDKKINTVYRQSRKLNTFAGELLKVIGGDVTAMGALPDESVHDGVDPVLLEQTSNDDAVTWLAERIGEIERMVQKMPTVAVLVPSEDLVKPMAEALTRQLEPINLKADACTDGKALGDDTDIRWKTAINICY